MAQTDMIKIATTSMVHLLASETTFLTVESVGGWVQQFLLLSETDNKTCLLY